MHEIIVIVQADGLTPAKFTRTQINKYSSEFNADDTISEIGSADFREALVDLLVEEGPDDEAWNDWIADKLSEKNVMEHMWWYEDVGGSDPVFDETRVRTNVLWLLIT